MFNKQTEYDLPVFYNTKYKNVETTLIYIPILCGKENLIKKNETIMSASCLSFALWLKIFFYILFNFYIYKLSLLWLLFNQKIDALTHFKKLLTYRSNPK